MEIKIIGTRKARKELRTVNLNEPPETRWRGILQEDGVAVKKLLRQAATWMPEWLPGIGAWAFGKAYQASGGYYVEEIEAIADYAGLDFGHVCMLQCQYELAHAGEYAGSIFGCTTGVVRDPRLGMLHLRNMDWALSSIKGATRLIRFTQGKREFVAVGIVGFVGILSGMVPGAYSVTLNYAPPSERPGFDFGPAFLLRHVLETCDTMKEAVSVLRRRRLSSPAFFTVCGLNEAVTVECTRTEYEVNRMDDNILVHANHHTAECFEDLNDVFDEDVLEFSIDRQRCMERKLRGKHKTMAGWAAALRSYPVYNSATMQRMVFRAAKREIWLGN